MAWPIQDHANAVLALLAGATGSPALTVYDGQVATGTAPPYVVTYFYIETPDGLTEPDKVPLTQLSDVINLWIFCHCVGASAAAARAVSGRVRAALLHVTPVIAGRSCWRIQAREGRPPSRNEETGVTVMDQVDTYYLKTIPS